MVYCGDVLCSAGEEELRGVGACRRLYDGAGKNGVAENRNEGLWFILFEKFLQERLGKQTFSVTHTCVSHSKAHQLQCRAANPSLLLSRACSRAAASGAASWSLTAAHSPECSYG